MSIPLSSCEECGRSTSGSCWQHPRTFPSPWNPLTPYPNPMAPPMVAPSGWVCPKCGAVMAPSMPCCVRCTGATSNQDTREAE